MSELCIKDFIDKNTAAVAKILNVSNDYDKLYTMLNEYLDELTDEDAAKMVSSLTEQLSKYKKDILSCFSKSIPALSFSGLTVKSSLHISSPIEDIDYGAFWRCKGLTRLMTSGSVKRIHAIAFQSCDDLEGVALGKGLKYIDDYAFAYCERLKDVFLASSVTNISGLAFGDKISDNIIFHVIKNSEAHKWCERNVNSENIDIL